VIRPLLAALDAIREVYEESSMGGALHIVLDDGNVEDEHLAWCATPEALAYCGGSMTDAERRCYDLLVQMSEQERAIVVSGYHGEVVL
jgi:hypothetical protein